MTARIYRSMFLLAAVAAPAVSNVACDREVQHTESDKPGWFGGNKHEESTTVQHPDGTMSTEKTETKTN